MMIRAHEPFRELTTSSEVIDAVGGTAAAAALAATASPTGICSLPSVSNWRSSGRLPPYTFLVFTNELATRGFRASSMLWGIAPVRERNTAS
jgi:hypothetical protein